MSAKKASNGVFIGVTEAVRRIRAGRMIVVVDDAERENEGDLVFAAEKATAEQVNFAVKHGRGILCAPMPFGISVKAHFSQPGVRRQPAPWRWLWRARRDYSSLPSSSARAFTSWRINT